MIRSSQIEIPRQPSQGVEAELSRLEQARDAAREEINRLQARVEAEIGQAEAAVFEAHAMFLDDYSLQEIVETALQRGANAESAWMEAVEGFSQELEQLDDPTLSARSADLRDVGRRVLAHLVGRVDEAVRLDRPVVIIAADLAPSQTAALDKTYVLGFCTAYGGATSHTAILAKALGLPAVVGLGEAVLQVRPGAYLLVDGARGRVVVDPGAEEIEAFERQAAQASGQAQTELSQAAAAAVTRDGRRVEVVANVGSLEDAHTALKMGAEGVGLLRTEFLFLERKTAPSEAEQVQAYRAILEVMGARPVVVRTLDVGGDKPLAYLDQGHEDNPFLGWRAIRLCLDRPDFFKIQLRALLRSAAGHDLRIMFPMIAALSEIRQAKALLEKARQELGPGAKAPAIQVGMMVEIPAAVVMAEQFAGEVDFFSVGTNDLTQYTFAAERTNPRLVHLADACHPAILRQIQRVISVAHAAGIWAGVCGELAGDAEAIPLLLAMGLDEFSMAAPSIPHAKALLRRLEQKALAPLLEKALECDSAAAVRSLVREFQV